MDREAYAERRAIMEVDAPDNEPMTAAREAADYAYKTRFGVVATAAANGDWQPARAWCAEISKRFGADTGAAVMRDIEEAIKAELDWRQ